MKCYKSIEVFCLRIVKQVQQLNFISVSEIICQKFNFAILKQIEPCHEKTNVQISTFVFSAQIV